MQAAPGGQPPKLVTRGDRARGPRGERIGGVRFLKRTARGQSKGRIS